MAAALWICWQTAESAWISFDHNNLFAVFSLNVAVIQNQIGAVKDKQVTVV